MNVQQKCSRPLFCCDVRNRIDLIVKKKCSSKELRYVSRNQPHPEQGSTGQRDVTRTSQRHTLSNRLCLKDQIVCAS